MSALGGTPGPSMQGPITVLAYPTVAPDWRERFLQAFDVLARHTRAEPGCLAFQLHAHPTDAGRFVVHEVFADKAALDAHAAAPHTRDFIDFIHITGSTLSCQPWYPLERPG
ncbi:putative quinol monooxygenase [Dyella marensis]|uniref:putative quinol monooxygenase n=1 Tax=Dyella marensis TaxID=500610 RepID=UPI0031D80984